MGKAARRAERKFANGQPINKLFARKVPFKERQLFEQVFRCPRCLYGPGFKYLHVNKLDIQDIRNNLAFGCRSMEQQILALRDLTQLTRDDYKNRFFFTQRLLYCLLKHHGVIYEGILFGSSVNGLGFRDSDVDLRIRPLHRLREFEFEPYSLDDETTGKTLRNIAFQTTRCSPALGEFVPSTRCPVAKLTFMRERLQTLFKDSPRNLEDLVEGLKFDISLGSQTPLGVFNSKFLRFLCYLEPKFHLLATVVRYWSSAHKLIVAGYLSSYALVNMLVNFCQTTDPPLLPTVNQMRDLYFANQKLTDSDTSLRGLTQVEWNTIICFDKKRYGHIRRNEESLAVLLLKFFEFYLNFPYSTHIITIRPGKALTHDEFKQSTQYHPRFPIKQYLNIQDPFDLKHNLTSGMSGSHFYLLINAMKHSYERLYNELLTNFYQPKSVLNLNIERLDHKLKNPAVISKNDARDWGLNALFVKIPDPNVSNQQEKEKVDKSDEIDRKNSNQTSAKKVSNSGHKRNNNSKTNKSDGIKPK